MASWLLAKELGGEADPASLFGAGERVCQKLSVRLSRRVSPDGSHAILSRTLHLARVEFPFFEGVRAGRAPGMGLEGLDARLHDVDAGEARQGLLVVVRTLLDLLVGFIGEELTLRMVREVWPDLPSRQPTRPGQEAAS